MKKKIATIIAVVLCMLCIPFSAFAAEQKDVVPVVAKVPITWEAPNLWAWADDGTNAFEAWPGNE